VEFPVTYGRRNVGHGHVDTIDGSHSEVDGDHGKEKT
jgi:hypothetical protein